VDKLIVLEENGDVTTLHSDDLPDFGPARVARASHVEPGAAGSDGWDVVLTDHPLNGDLAGHVVAAGIPMNRRQQALDAEVEFLQDHVL